MRFGRLSMLLAAVALCAGSGWALTARKAPRLAERPVLAAVTVPASTSTVILRVGAASVYRTAVRVDPPPPVPEVEPEPTIPEFASRCDEMSWYRQQAGLPAVFDRLGRRESNCLNQESVHTFCCWGWFQLWVDLHLRDARIAPGYAACGITSRHDVDSYTTDDMRRQACGAKALYDVMGLTPWT